MKTDILIVGSGCAGLYAALNLPSDKQITIITKDIVEHSDSFLAQGGMCMLKSEDDYDSYFEDTMKAGHYENNPKSVEVMIRSSVDVVNDLVKYGADFHREPDGSFSYTKEGAHSHHRIIFHEDVTGKEITSTLLRNVEKLSNVTIYEHVTMVDILCKDNCCYGWEIDIDEGTMDYYRSLGGELGKEITSHIREGEENTMIMREDGYCPFLNEKKLCDICIKMGEEALSEICTEFPRFTMEYEDVREKILSLACEEVGNIMFSTDEKITWQEHEMPDFCGTGDDDETACEDDGALYGNEEAACEDDASDGEAYDDDEEVSVDADQLNAVSKAAVALLQNRKKPVAERAAEYLLYCKRMQQELYGYHTGGEVSGQKQEQEQRESRLIAECREKEVTPQEAYAAFLARMERYEQLEVLDQNWEEEKKRLRAAFHEDNYLECIQNFHTAQQGREYEYEHLLVYFTFRYFMRSYYDDNILNKAQFAVASILMIRDMDALRFLENGGTFSVEDRVAVAKLYSKEVEHSEENMEFLEEDFQFEDIFAPEQMIRQLFFAS